MRIQFAVLSDVGRVRQNNEDTCLAETALGIFAVADVMGGHASGEVASRMAMDTLRKFLVQAKDDADATLRINGPPDSASPKDLLAQGVRLANHKIYQASQERSEYRGMGTTLVAVYFPSRSAVLANVGDSRLYQIRSGAIEQMTEDHSLVWEQYKQGLLPKEALSSAPHKNIVTRALGIHPTVEVDLRELSLQSGDILLFCTDGLSDLVEDHEMLGVVMETPENLDGAARKLVDLANSRGGKDNITVLFIQIES